MTSFILHETKSTKTKKNSVQVVKFKLTNANHSRGSLLNNSLLLTLLTVTETNPPSQNRKAPRLTSSSDLMALSFIIIWKRSRLFVPMGWSSNSLHRATSWGRSRCSSVSSSSNSLENRTMSFVVGCSPVPRTCRRNTDSLTGNDKTTECLDVGRLCLENIKQFESENPGLVCLRLQ